MRLTMILADQPAADIRRVHGAVSPRSRGSAPVEPIGQVPPAALPAARSRADLRAAR